MKVLIGSNGGLTGVYLAKQYNKMTDVDVLGFDSSEDNIGHLFVKQQFILPRADDPSFIEKLLFLLNEYQVDVYLPTHSRETAVVSRYEDHICSHTETKFMVSPWKTFAALENKQKASESLKSINIPVPEMIDDDRCIYPIVMKKDIGSGSNGMILIENAAIHQAYMQTCKEVSFYQKINGTEYTADCMFDQSGELIGYNQRRRIKTIGGAVSITKNDPSFDIFPWLNKIARAWQFRGCVNFQYIVEKNVPYFIDINLRFPSGGLPLSVMSGLDVPGLYLSILNGQTVKPFVMSESKKHMTMYRYFEEAFEE